eukprot:jgi/Hompol1/761/HPOL_003917-RA
MMGGKLNQYGLYELDCRKVTSLPNVTFSLAGHDFQLTYQDLVLTDSETCVSIFGRTPDTFTVFGSVFLKKYYITFDLAGSVGFAQRTGDVLPLFIPQSSPSSPTASDASETAETEAECDSGNKSETIDEKRRFSQIPIETQILFPTISSSSISSVSSSISSVSHMLVLALASPALMLALSLCIGGADARRLADTAAFIAAFPHSKTLDAAHKSQLPPFKSSLLLQESSASLSAGGIGQTLVATILVAASSLVSISESFWKAYLVFASTSPIIRQLNILDRETYGDGTSVSCSVITDQVSIAGVTLMTQPICVALALRQTTLSPEDGLIGLGPPQSVSSEPADLFANLRSSFNQSKISFFYNRAVNSIDGSSEVVPNAGEITFGDPNPARFTGSFTWIPINPSDPHWAVTIDSITVNGQSMSFGQTALMDTGTTLIYITNPMFATINAQMNGIATNGMYQVDCTKVRSFPPITFSMGGASFTLTWDKQVVVLQNRFCVSVFSEALDGLPSILGVSFLRHFYTSFDFSGQGRIGIAATTAPPAPPNLPSTSGLERNSALTAMFHRSTLIACCGLAVLSTLVAALG